MKTPSYKLDQQENLNKFQDKYIGRVPVFLHAIPEANIYECNPEYLVLIWQIAEGTVPSQNMSIELYNQCVDDLDMISEPGENTAAETALINCFNAKYPDYFEVPQ